MATHDSISSSFLVLWILIKIFSGLPIYGGLQPLLSAQSMVVVPWFPGPGSSWFLVPGLSMPSATPHFPTYSFLPGVETFFIVGFWGGLFEITLRLENFGLRA